MYKYIKSEVEKAVPAAINKRHIIHRNPELSFMNLIRLLWFARH